MQNSPMRKPRIKLTNEKKYINSPYLTPIKKPQNSYRTNCKTLYKGISNRRTSEIPNSVVKTNLAMATLKDAVQLLEKLNADNKFLKEENKRLIAEKSENSNYLPNINSEVFMPELYRAKQQLAVRRNKFDNKNMTPANTRYKDSSMSKLMGDRFNEIKAALAKARDRNISNHSDLQQQYEINNMSYEGDTF